MKVKCEDCDQEMLTAETCKLTRVKSSKGKTYFRIPYGAEYLPWWENPERMKQVQDIDRITQKCRDCGVNWGNIHHNGCDFERCPNCLGQFIACDCAEGMEILP